MKIGLKIGVTGAQGLLGWHFSAYARMLEGVSVVGAGRAEFGSPQALTEFVSGCDGVVHFAGLNRGEEREVARANIALTQSLIQALKSCSSTAHVLFASSTHIERDSAYGASKRECARLLAEWADQAGGRFSNVVLPGVFGEQGRPFYNSVVSTFCQQLASGQSPTVHADAPLKLIHAQEVARVFVGLLNQGHSGDLRVMGRSETVLGLLERLKALQALYAEHIIPDLRNDYSRDLFNTFRSYLYPQHYPVSLALHSDPRGFLFEAVRTHSAGQSFLSSTAIGVTRGNHYHTRKVERFLVVQGEAEIRLRRVLHPEVHTFRVSGSAPCYVDIPTLYTHSLTNTGSGELLTLFWTHEIYDPAHPDTTPEAVLMQGSL